MSGWFDLDDEDGTMAATIDPVLYKIKKTAEEIAARRSENATGAHLLAALASCPGAISDLLNERRLGARVLLSAFDGLERPLPDESLKAAFLKCRDLALRTGAPSVGPEHLLIALLSDTRSVARRTLDACGADAARLRVAALNLGLGIVARRRTTPAAEQSESTKLPEAPAQPPAKPAKPDATVTRKLPAGIAVPVMPLRPVKPILRARRALRSSNPGLPSAEGARALEPSSSSSPPAAPEAAATAGAAPPALSPAEREPKSSPGDARERRFVLDPRKFPVLCKLGKNLTLAAARRQLDPVVGREVAVEQTLDVLAKRQANNPCLVGEPGVGKTSVVRGLAQVIADAEGGRELDERIVIELPISELLAGTGVRGALAARLGAVKNEVAAAAGRVVLFLDEIHQLFSGDAADEIGSDLKLALARGELPCIGATTFEEFQRLVDKDPALARRFSLVEVPEPSREDAFLILDALSRKLEAHHGVRYDKQALALSINWSIRYLPGRALPDKAVSIIDLAGARVRRRGGGRVDIESVAEVVAGLVDTPIERLLESDGDRMLRLEEILAERIVGHGPHIAKISRILRRNAAGLGSRRPIGTFLLLGPTGVGKTETAKAIAEVLFETDMAMTRIDFSEYSEAHSVAKLIGAPPGYVGHDAGGQLTEAVRRRPYQVVLLDEIEKAHPDVLTTFLAVFDEGRMTDGRGRLVDFCNTVILMTSNLGAEQGAENPRRRVGFSQGAESTVSDQSARMIAAARDALPPELYNRIDEVLAFTPLTRGDVSEIARRMLARLAGALRIERGVELQVEESAVETLLEMGGFDPTLGARPMKRSIARLLEAPLAEKILKGEIERGDLLLVEGDDQGLSFEVLPGDVSSSAAE
ncbi:MAG TPA: ATP-dependent Clp protease ATP-binding subunit [Polyangiaceae bacterium]